MTEPVRPQRQLLTLSELNLVNEQLTPAVGRPTVWDGAADENTVVSEEAAMHRAELAKELGDAMSTHLKAVLDRNRWKDKANKLPMTSLLGAARAAKKVVDDYLADWLGLAVLTTAQRAARDRPTPNLLESTDAGNRELAGNETVAADTARWIASNDPECQAIAHDHGFDANRPQEAHFLENSILKPFRTANDKELLEYDRLAFGSSVPERGMALVSGAIEDWPEYPSEATETVRIAKWEKFTTLVHEYLHTLQHPHVATATTNNAVVREGVCELLTLEVLKGVLAPGNRAGRELLAEDIQGTNDPVPADDRITGYRSPRDYLDLVDRARKIEQVIGTDRLLSAFLLGHTEFLGLTMVGRKAEVTHLTPAKRHVIQLPRLMRLADVAAWAHLDPRTIIDANPGLEAMLRSGGEVTALVLPGRLVHRVVSVVDTGPTDDVQVTETWAQVAAQHGVPTEAVREINLPDALRTGRVLIPVRDQHRCAGCAPGAPGCVRSG